MAEIVAHEKALKSALSPVKDGEGPFPLTEADKRELALIRSFIAGDDKAFLTLYARYEAPLLLYCRKMCNDAKLAEDVFQETWIRIFELRKREVKVIRFRSLLFRTARNVSLNRLRKELVRSRNTSPVTESSAITEFESESEHEELRMLISTALGKLPIAEREVFILHEYSGFSFTEISSILGRSMTNVKTLAFRARTRLRKLVSSWLGLGEESDPLQHFVFAQSKQKE
jgi:RNA polymerase sigma-70 factor (ECF subfamily)